MILTKDFLGFKLYYQGNWDDALFDKCVAVIGSRRMTTYGQRVVEKLIPQLVQQGYTIISGFMYGIDQYAHKTCVDYGGRTIAVLGWGINEPLADGDLQLAEKIIINKGLLISLWADQKGTLWTFPARNRVVAALASDIYVIEAGLKSGSLITVDMALSRGRRVWAVPGPITSSVSAGTNQLIATGQAKIWLGHNDQTPNLKTQTNSNNQNPILKIIENESLDASEIARKLNKPIAEIGAELTMLVLSGDIVEREGKYYMPFLS